MFNAKFKTNCRMRQPKNGPNKTEAEYSKLLWNEMHAGNIQSFGFERIKLKLADNTFYTPDFFVVAGDGSISIVEVKGHWEDDARVKIKVAAEQYPWIQFVAVKPRPKKDGGGWIAEIF